MIGPDLQDLVDGAALVSGAPVTLEDREFNLVAVSAHQRPGDAVRQDSIMHRRATPEVRRYFESFGIAHAADPVHIPPDPRRGLLGRLCVPVRWQSVTYGYLWLLEDPEAGAADGRPMPLAQLLAAAGRAGVEMARRSRLREDLGWKVGDLLSTYPETRARAAEEIAESWSLPPGTPVAAVSVRPAGGSGAVFVNAWRLPRTILVGSGEHAATVIVPLSAPGELSAARGMIRSAFAALTASAPPGAAAPTPVAGIGGPADSLVRARESWLQARIAARVAASRRPDGPLVLEWPQLGVHRLLGAGTDAALREAVVTSGVAALLAEGGAQLVRTAKAYLDEAGSAQRAAQTLSIHRQTLYHRLERIERISGLDLGSGQDRLQLHLALTVLPDLDF
ncbi:helix-turn-helix domain-containing protein [Actinocrinis puniceicyclus]|uniref:Helix-turn-helix domain-containing protein n=1 Tax=Actinocrinis puniceicyclus TaxID=977794 RepID=A0A8J7WST1_9ACTN|nr:helix-turn-helix domain-containing protein [Actinocrinis puniceicyclus]MBS2965010.1 helix-turn-helix domain-containing protein [Actinocrinis puniceicyclus]